MDEPETLTIMVKTFFGVTCFSVTLEWGDGNSCHFNSFVNVFMNAINTSFTLLCFWIPLGCGLCQFLSPRRRPHHTTFRSAVWLSTDKLNLPKAGVSRPHAVAVVLMGHTTHLRPRQNPPPPGKRAHTQAYGDKAIRKASWLTQSKITAGQEMPRTQGLEDRSQLLLQA